MSHPLYVAFLWHMHQPYYRDTLTDDYSLPWTRLHGAKNYLRMVRLLQDYPKLHVTFNFVPCLVEQLEDYASGRAADQTLRVSLQGRLSQEYKRYLLSFFFSLNADRVISRYPRYWQLLQLRDAADGDVSVLSDAYWRDLIAWFNLAWIDPGQVAADPHLASLARKGRDFTASDIRLIIEKQREICGAVVPACREAEASGRVEISTSPYYHPILPLLVDTASARRASEGLPLPSPGFSHPEDAAEQLRRAVDGHEHFFGRRPRGLWPSEGAVSQEVADLVARGGWFEWMASDEELLGRSIGVSFDRDGNGHLTNPRPLCQPYRLGDDGPAIVFRDRLLSDRIGFVYKGTESREAAVDFVRRLERIRETIADSESPYLISIVLDGENPWDSYQNNGDDFLRHLYGLLSDSDTLRTVTIGEYVRQFPPRLTLDHLATGSWIYGSLETWIGEREQNIAWERLSETRQALSAWQAEQPTASEEIRRRAWEEMYIAEGSDWFWWYCRHNHFGNEGLFDVEFRKHLGNVYRIADLGAPEWLRWPILGSAPHPVQGIRGYLWPSVRADSEPAADWAGAGLLEATAGDGTMQRSTSVFRRLHYGYNPTELFLRLELREALALYSVAVSVGLTDRRHPEECPKHEGLGAPGCERFPVGFEVRIEPGRDSPALMVADEAGLLRLGGVLNSAAIGDRVLELSLSLRDLGTALGESLNLLCVVARDGVASETLPAVGFLRIDLLPLS